MASIDLYTKQQTDSKFQTKPSAAGTAGQVLGLDNNLDPVWVNQSGGGGTFSPTLMTANLSSSSDFLTIVDSSSSTTKKDIMIVLCVEQDNDPYMYGLVSFVIPKGTHVGTSAPTTVFTCGYVHRTLGTGSTLIDTRYGVSGNNVELETKTGGSFASMTFTGTAISAQAADVGKFNLYYF